MLNLEPQQDKQRQFICPCSKSYFSYAALFTHIKQKHQGKAPGQIVKPLPENKRGRPRKNTHQVPSYSTHQSSFMVKTPSKSQDLLLNDSPNSKEDLKQKIFSFKPTAGSTFKQYQSEDPFIPAINQPSTPNSFQAELFQDLSKSFQFEFLNTVPDILLKKQKNYSMISDEGESGDIVDCIRNFLKFCQIGVRKQTHSQLVLLMLMLLQHIIDSQKEREIRELSTNQIHKHIISFFDYLAAKSKEIDLTPYKIFNNISAIKSLIVFFNWLNRYQAEQHQKSINLLRVVQNNDFIKLFQFYLRRLMDIVFSNRISANIFKECARTIIEQKQYNDVPIEMRKKVEDCLDTYMDHHNIVIAGAEKVKIVPVAPNQH